MHDLLTSLLAIATAHAADFQIVPGIPGPLNPSSSGGILAFIQNAYLFALGIAGLLAVASIAWGGIQYTVSRGNPSQLSDAWDRIVQAFVGVLLLVGAGTILSVVNPGLTSLELPDLQNVDEAKYEAAQFTISPGATNPAPTAETIAEKPTKGGTGKCTAISAFPDNPCSVQKLKQSCFGALGDDVVAQASKVCNAESGANPINYNRGYTCAGGKIVVVGAFQIHLLYHKLPTANGVLNCPKAFRKGGGAAGCTVIDENLYNQCVSAAKTSAVSIATACNIYKARKTKNKWGDWEVTHCTPKKFACCGNM